MNEKKKELQKYIKKKINDCEKMENRTLKKARGGAGNKRNCKDACEMEGVDESSKKNKRCSTRRKAGEWLIMDIDEMLPVHIELDNEFNEDWSNKPNKDTSGDQKPALSYVFVGLFPNIASLISIVENDDDIKENIMLDKIRQSKTLSGAKQIMRNIKSNHYIMTKGNGIITYILNEKDTNLNSNLESQVLQMDSEEKTTIEQTSKSPEDAKKKASETNEAKEAAVEAAKEAAVKAANEAKKYLDKINNITKTNVNLVSLISNLELSLKYVKECLKKNKLYHKLSKTPIVLHADIIFDDDNNDYDLEYEKQYMKEVEYENFITYINKLNINFETGVPNTPTQDNTDSDSSETVAAQ